MIPSKLKQTVLELRSSEWVKTLLSQSNVFLVGGSVRDGFLNKPIKDVDLIVEGLSLCDIRECLVMFGNVDIVGESFSVIKFKPFGHKGEPFDIATPRMDRKVGNGHRGFEIITDGIDVLTDLKRRDFTVNSIAINVDTMELVDPFDGLDDLLARTLRATDSTAFVEDPLRILRGVQFASRFGFVIEPNTLNLMKTNAHLVEEISGERIFEELKKIVLKNGDVDLAFQLLKTTGLETALFGREMTTINKQFGKLDEVSFFFALGTLGGVNPSSFVKTRLKGDSLLEKNLQVLYSIMTQTFCMNDEDLRLFLLKSFEKAPDVMSCTILPKNVKEIMNMMESGEIPMTKKSIQLTGLDVMGAFPHLKDVEIGKKLERVFRDALMNRFDWKNRQESLEYLHGTK